jgi:type II pantothenate kinase
MRIFFGEDQLAKYYFVGYYALMNILAIDFGGSTIDVVRFEAGEFVSRDSYERNQVDTSGLEQFIEDAEIDLEGAQEIRVTGGKSHQVAAEISDVPVRRVNEIQAIGAGGKWLFESDEDCLVVSMGTGTCMVAARDGGFEHVGGTGVGGGTFVSLCNLILKESDPEKLVEMFAKGDRFKVDLSVKDIVGKGIGKVPGHMTASNLGKIARTPNEIDFEQEDLAAGVANLVGQTIATSAVFAARAENLTKVVLAGKLSRIEPIVKIIFEVGELYEREIVLPKNAEYVSAIGAAVVK